jgi:hypothetical protein
MAGAVDKHYKGAVSKLFFPYIKDRMQTMIPISAEFKATVTGHVYPDSTAIDPRLFPIQRALVD